MRFAFCGLLVILPDASAVCAGASATDDEANATCLSDPSNLLQASILHNRSGPADSPDDEQRARDKRVWEEIKAGDAMDVAAGGIGSLVVGAIKGDSGEELAKSALSTVLDLGVAAIAAKVPFVGPFVDIGITIFKDLVLGSTPPPPFMTEDDVKKMLEKFQVTVQEDTKRLIASDAFKEQVKTMKKLMDKYDTHLRSSKDPRMQPGKCKWCSNSEQHSLCASGLLGFPRHSYSGNWLDH